MGNFGERRVGILGVGNMGGAILRGLIEGGHVTAGNVVGSRPDYEVLEPLVAELGFRATPDNCEVARGADAPRAAFHHAVDDLILRTVERCRVTQRLLEVLALILASPHPCLSDRFFPGLGDVGVNDQATLGSVDGVAVLLGRGFGDLPEVLEVSGVASAVNDADRKHPESVLACSTMPDGDYAAAVAIGKCGCVYGRRCRVASRSVNHSAS